MSDRLKSTIYIYIVHTWHGCMNTNTPNNLTQGDDWWRIEMDLALSHDIT